jgi:hypothetical protein
MDQFELKTKVAVPVISAETLAILVRQDGIDKVLVNHHC